MNLYYRGSLKSCNYRCHYCPLKRKAAISDDDLNRDKRELEHFTDAVLQSHHDVQKVMIVPYGEALVHDYYFECINRITEGSIKVGVQTNLSFDARKVALGRNSLLFLWASYHPSMVEVQAFIDQVHLIKQTGINLSVGAVADPEKIQILESLKKRLPEGVTFWLNRYEGFKRHYTKDEIESFSTMDLNLKNELARFKANAGACTAGRESLFVHSNGDISPCLMNERVIGNLYDSKPLKETICSLNVCRCYLCYACRKDLSLPYKDPFFRF